MGLRTISALLRLSCSIIEHDPLFFWMVPVALTTPASLSGSVQNGCGYSFEKVPNQE
jgi:hypothetical protein